MKFSTKQPELHKAIQMASKAVTGRSTMPVLNNILVTVEDGVATFTASDLEYLEVSAGLEVNVDDPGSTTIPAKFLLEAIGGMGRGDVVISAGDNHATISSGKSKYNTTTVPASEFSTMEAISDAKTIAVPAAKLCDAIAKTLFATSKDQSRPVMTGSLFRVTGDVLTIVSTDTYRLAVKTVDCDNPHGADIAAIISRTALGEVLRMASMSENDITIAVSASQACFSTNDVSVSTRLISGEYLHYDKVAPASSDLVISAKFDAKEFAAALSRAMTVSRDDGNKVVLNVTDTGIDISASFQGSEYQETLEAETRGGNITTAYNAVFINDMLGQAEGAVEFRWPNNPLGKSTLTQVNDDSYLYVAMPMSVQK